jgi:glycosyltransferase involved in cell wall biosynthesis
MTLTGPVNVCMLHAFDPRGQKVGGLETYVRDYITYLPRDANLLLVGVDGFGDLELGKVHRLSFRGRDFDFLPVLRVMEDQTNVYATRVTQSLTFNFLVAILRYSPVLKRLIQQGGYTLELRRIEHALVPILFGARYIQMLHDGMSRDKAMSSLLKKYWWVKQLSEKLTLQACEKLYCVSDELTGRLRAENPGKAYKIDTLTTWANPDIFKPSPFNFSDEGINLFYAGRLDKFKRPDLMFRLVAMVRDRSTAPVAFHYVGDGDPHEFPEFSEIENITVRHGRRTSADIAELLKSMHIGILTSDFEGMPRVVMETLTAGRPVVALHLPQLEAVIHAGRSGHLVPRGPEELSDHADRVLEVYSAARAGLITPEAVAGCVSNYTPQALLGRIYADHRNLQNAAA